MATSIYWVQADLEDRLSAEVVKQILDDNLDGAADATPVTRLQKDSSSKVDSYLRPIYGKAMPLAAPYPNEVIRLALDVAEALAAKRHPAYVRRAWKELMDAAEADLDKLRRGVVRLDVGVPPEPAANEGGSVRSGDPANPTPNPKFFADGTGDF